LLGPGMAFSQQDMVLWYDRPATYFEETLVLGNGKHGASVFGGIPSEKIYLNDATLWSGEPVDPHMNPDAHKHITQIRKTLKAEDCLQTEQLNTQLQINFSQSYAPLGTMYIDFRHQGYAENYRRELDIDRAVSRVRYNLDGIRHTREYFVSHPDKVMVVRLSGSKKGALSFDVKFQSLLKY